MFDVGFSELLLCFVVALVVLGPEKLPKLARTLGQWTGQARGYLRGLTAELDRESRLSEIKKELEEANRLVREQQNAVRELMNRATTDVDEVRRDVADSLAPPKDTPRPSAPPPSDPS